MRDQSRNDTRQQGNSGTFPPSVAHRAMGCPIGASPSLSPPVFLNVSPSPHTSPLPQLAYVVRMALWMYHRAADLTLPCDAAVDSACSNRSVAPGPIVGVYGQCLLEQTAGTLGSECAQLVEVIRSNGGHAGGVIDNTLLQDALNKIAMVRDGGWMDE